MINQKNVAKELGVSVTTVAVYIKKLKLKTKTVNGSNFIDDSDLEKLKELRDKNKKYFIAHNNYFNDVETEFMTNERMQRKKDWLKNLVPKYMTKETVEKIFNQNYNPTIEDITPACFLDN